MSTVKNLMALIQYVTPAMNTIFVNVAEGFKLKRALPLVMVFAQDADKKEVKNELE